MSDIPHGYSSGKMPDLIKKRPEGLPTGRIILINHEWYVEFTHEGKDLTKRVRDDDAWNCDIEVGIRVWLCNYPDDGGWRVVWRDGMKRFVKVDLDHFSK